MENINNVIIGNFNISSRLKKIDDLKALVTGMLDFVIITETKLDNTFPVSQFQIDGYFKPCRLHRNRNGGGREDICQRMSDNICQRKHSKQNVDKIQLSR